MDAKRIWQRHLESRQPDISYWAFSVVSGYIINGDGIFCTSYLSLAEFYTLKSEHYSAEGRNQRKTVWSDNLYS